ncbi:MAG TPA: hypothetical protein VF796_09300 [Humisphaera sp.]
MSVGGQSHPLLLLPELPELPLLADDPPLLAPARLLGVGTGAALDVPLDGGDVPHSQYSTDSGGGGGPPPLPLDRPLDPELPLDPRELDDGVHGKKYRLPISRPLPSYPKWSVQESPQAVSGAPTWTADRLGVAALVCRRSRCVPYTPLPSVKSATRPGP